MRLSFLTEAAAAARLATRARRLSADRGQPELANAEMMNWAVYLRGEAARSGCDILDTSHRPLAESVAAITAYFPAWQPRP